MARYLISFDSKTVLFDNSGRAIDVVFNAILSDVFDNFIPSTEGIREFQLNHRDKKEVSKGFLITEIKVLSFSKLEG